jgi:hypothetical protein
VPAHAEALQGETGRADRDALRGTSRDLVLGCVVDDKPLSHAFAHLTPEFTCKGIK